MRTFGGATPLMYACQQCRENQVLDILTKQPYAVKDRDRTLKTPLHYCAENANTGCAETVLKFAPELVNAQDENGYSSLHLAVIAGNKSLIKLLIEKGADVNIYDNEGHSAVHWAIVSSEKEALEMIIQAGANPSTPDIHGGYPLHYAVQMCGSTSDYIRNFEDTVRVVETLLNSGVDVNVKDKDGRQPILWAASAGSAEAVIHLVSAGACVEAADKDGLTALHCAASRGHTTTLDTLITLCGTNVDVIDGNGCSALFYAVTLGHADATEVLLNLGAEPNRQDRKGRTPAHCGAAKGQLETLRILQKHGGNLWLRNVKGDIPLHEAVASGRKDLVLWLLSQNPEAVNIANNDGRCPLHISAMYNNTEMVKILLDAKSLVNPVMRTSKGVLMTPLNVALCKGHRSCGKYLQLHGGVPFSKVAKVEPTSAFAFRVSPSDMVENVTENNTDHLMPNKTKVSVSNTSTDIQITKTETTDKKKVYRRRKKRKTVKTDFQESDSDDTHISKTKTSESRKTDQDKNEEGEVDEETDEDEKTTERKVQLNNEKNDKNAQEKTSKTVSVNNLSAKTKNDGALKKTKTVSKTKAEPKPLPRNKFLKENKNVSNLSPDDFPPLMQTVNQLDSVIIEPEIEMNKATNEYDLEGGLRGQSLSPGELNVSEEATDILKNTQEINKTENQQNNQTPESEEMKEKKLLKENEPNEKKTTPQKHDKSEKSVKKSTNDVKKDEKTFRSTGSRSSGSEGSGQKSEKSVKSTTFNGVKKDDKTQKPAVQKDSSSDGHDKSKKSVSPKGVKSADSTPKSENSDKKVENAKVKILEKELNGLEVKEESALISSKTKSESENEKEKESSKEPVKESVSSSEGNKLEENPKAVSEVSPEEIKLDKVAEKISYAESEVAPSLEVKNSDEKLTVPIKEMSVGKDSSNMEDVLESASVQQTEAVKSPEAQTVEENISMEETNVRRKDSSPQLILTEETKHEKADVTPVADVSGSNNKLPETEGSNITVAEPLQDDLHIGLSVTPEQNTLLVEKQKSSGDLIEEQNFSKDSPEDHKPSKDSPEKQKPLKDSPEKQKPLKDSPEKQKPSKDSPEEQKPSKGSPEKQKPSKGSPEKQKSPKEPPEEPKSLEGSTQERVRENSPEKTKALSITENMSKELPTEVMENSKNIEDRNNNHEANIPVENLDSSGNLEKEAKDGSEGPQNKPAKVPRLCRRHKDLKYDVNQSSVTQLVQSTVKKYHMERGIFYQLLELKRYQIRSGKANEQVLVKRLADDYERSRSFLGMKPYTGLYKFREFERFLYDQLKALNSRRSFIIPEIKSYDDIDALSGFLKKSRYKIFSETPQQEMVCTCITQRCHHSACAYTSVPCSAYIADLRHHRHHRKRKECFFPRIDQPQVDKSKNQKYTEQPATLELVQGNQKHVITLPQNYPQKSKRYYVTFTIKGVTSPDDATEDSKDYFKHRHAKSV